VKLRAITKP